MATAPKKRGTAPSKAGAGKASGASSSRPASRGAGLAAPVRPESSAKTYTSKAVDISFAGEGHRFARADLEIRGIYHGEASYEGRVFLNNEAATAATPCALTDGYAGSFHIFGHGGCVGDAGHCEIKGTKRDPNDLRFPHPLTPARKAINVTAALREIAKTQATVKVTIVPVVLAANELCDTKDVFRCEGMRFVSYNSSDPGGA